MYIKIYGFISKVFVFFFYALHCLIVLMPYTRRVQKTPGLPKRGKWKGKSAKKIYQKKNELYT